MANYTTKRHFDSLDATIKVARSRAKSSYQTHYIYQEEQGFYVSKGGPWSDVKPVAKVLWDGTVERFDQEEPTK